MLFLSEHDVASMLTMEEALPAVERAMRDHGSQRAIDVPRERARAHSGTLNILQGVAPPAGVAGYKAYYATPQGSRSHIYLYDAGSGVPLALLESNAFNVVRTGAASGVATRVLARADAAVAGQIGAGRMGMGQLEAVCAVRRIRRAQVYARNPERLERFCSTMARRLGIEVVPAHSGEEAVRHADVVNVITNSSVPVLSGAWLAAGQHVNAAGANVLTRRELDEAAVARCDAIVLDSRATAAKECGDLLPLIERGRLHWPALPELGEVLAGVWPGRADDGQVTLYESHGMALQDLYLAARVVELARARGLGHAIGSTPPPAGT